MSKTTVARLLHDPNKGITQTSGTNGMLARLFREFLISYNVTFDKWELLIRGYVKAVADEEVIVAKYRGETQFEQTKEDLTSLRTNMRNALSENTMTWPTFIKAMRMLRGKKFNLAVKGVQTKTDKELAADIDVFVSEHILPEGNTDFPDVCLNLLLAKLLEQVGLTKLEGPLWDSYASAFVERESEVVKAADPHVAKSKIGNLRTNLKKKILRVAMTWPTFVTGLRFLQLPTATVTVTLYPENSDPVVQELIIFIDEDYEP